MFLNVIGLSQYALALTVVVGLFAFAPLVGDHLDDHRVDHRLRLTTTGLITLIFLATSSSTSPSSPGVLALSRCSALVMLAAISGYLLLGMIGAILAIL